MERLGDLLCVKELELNEKDLKKHKKEKYDKAM